MTTVQVYAVTRGQTLVRKDGTQWVRWYDAIESHIRQNAGRNSWYMGAY